VAVARASGHTPALVSWLFSILAAALLGDPGVDAELLQRIAGGDKKALRALYEALSGRGMALAVRILGDRSDAEDVTQETFVEAWKRAGQYDPTRGGAAAMVMTIARSRAIDRRRARGTAARARETMAAEPDHDEGPLPFELADQRRERERVTM